MGDVLENYLDGLDLGAEDKSTGSDLDPANFADDEGTDKTKDPIKTETDKAGKDGKQSGDDSDDEDEEDSDKIKDDATKTEREKQLEAENAKLKDKLKRGYKNHEEMSKKVVTHEDMHNYLAKVETQRQEEFELVDKFPDSKKQLSELRKMANEKGLSLEDAYVIKNKAKFTDPARMNALSSDRFKSVGNYAKKEADDLAEKILSQGPKFMGGGGFGSK